MDGLGDLPRFERENTVMKPVSSITDLQFLMLTAKYSEFMEAILVSARKDNVNSTFVISLKTKL